MLGLKIYRSLVSPVWGGIFHFVVYITLGDLYKTLKTALKIAKKNEDEELSCFLSIFPFISSYLG